MTERRVRHHIVPRFYLERFAVDGVLEGWDRQEQNLFHSSPRNTAVIRDFYTLYDDRGTPNDTLEVDVLDRQVEAPAAPAISTLLAQGVDALSPDERMAIANFVSFQYARGQRFPEPMERAAARVLELHRLMTADFMDQGYRVAGVEETLREFYGREPTEEERQEFRDSLRNTEDFQITVERPGLLTHYLRAAAEGAPMLTRRPWHLARFDVPSLLTADEPTWLEVRPYTGPYGVGIGTADAVWMALDPFTALRIGQPGQQVLMEEYPAKWLNTGVIQQSHRFIYGQPGMRDGLDWDGR